jgi:hypothetical protein
MARSVTREAIAAELCRAIAALGPGRTICPSEIARALAPEDWRPLLGEVRRAAAELAAAGEVGIFRKGKLIAPQEMRGVIRLGRAMTGDRET